MNIIRTETTEKVITTGLIEITEVIEINYEICNYFDRNFVIDNIYEIVSGDKYYDDDFSNCDDNKNIESVTYNVAFIYYDFLHINVIHVVSYIFIYEGNYLDVENLYDSSLSLASNIKEVYYVKIVLRSTI